MHAIVGFIATVLAVMQPFAAFLRPSPNSQYRFIFNWGHWLIGMTAWGFASTAMHLIRLTKWLRTALRLRYYGRPNWIMGGYILFFIGINVIMEMLATNNEPRMEKNGPNGMALSHLNGPAVESPLAPPTVSYFICT
ncbi:hypothetical protein COOONC_12233 [Cooperia oncophora]